MGSLRGPRGFPSRGYLWSLLSVLGTVLSGIRDLLCDSSVTLVSANVSKRRNSENWNFIIYSLVRKWNSQQFSSLREFGTRSMEREEIFCFLVWVFVCGWALRSCRWLCIEWCHRFTIAHWSGQRIGPMGRKPFAGPQCNVSPAKLAYARGRFVGTVSDDCVLTVTLSRSMVIAVGVGVGFACSQHCEFLRQVVHLTRFQHGRRRRSPFLDVVAQVLRESFCSFGYTASNIRAPS